jgi:hypothetical protein
VRLGNTIPPDAYGHSATWWSPRRHRADLGWGTATPVHPARAGVLREQCTVLLPGDGRRTIFLAARHGSTWLGATVQPASNLMMPAWAAR